MSSHEQDTRLQDDISESENLYDTIGQYFGSVGGLYNAYITSAENYEKLKDDYKYIRNRLMMLQRAYAELREKYVINLQNNGEN